jgi:hypothetical protein
MANLLKVSINASINKLLNDINGENKEFIQFEKEISTLTLKIKNIKNVFDTKQISNDIDKLHKQVASHYNQKELSRHLAFGENYKDPNIYTKGGGVYKVTDKELAQILQSEPD